MRTARVNNFLKIAVDYYSARSSEKDILEYLRLLKESKDKKQFITALLENGDFLLNGEKRFITNGSVADLMVVYGRNGAFPHCHLSNG